MRPIPISDNLTTITARALVIREPWISHILSGRKIWEMRSKTTNIRGPVCIVRQESGIVMGVARLIDSPPPLTRENYMVHRDKHSIPESMLDDVLTNGWIYPWVFADVQKLREPVPYQHKSGAVTFVSLEPDVIKAIATQVGASFFEMETVAPAREMPTVRPATQQPSAPPALPAAVKTTSFGRAGPVQAAPPAPVPPLAKSSVQAKTGSLVFVFRPEKAQAFARPLPDGRIVVDAGSTAMRNGSPKVKRDLAERDRLVRQGVLVPDSDPELYRFSRDWTFGSSSVAAGVVKDGNASGPQLWKNEQSGETLRDWLSRQS